MKSINTYYNGNYYRSRLEARWAYFFDSIGVKYLYEPEGFKSKDGECYLPDFYLPETYLRSGYNDPTPPIDYKNFDESYKIWQEAWEMQYDKGPKPGVYIEIKHEHYNEGDFSKEWFDKNLVLFCGQPINVIWGYNYEDKGYQISPWWDNYMLFWICEKCKTTKIEFAEGNYNDCPKCGSACDFRLLYSKAKDASVIRFEHKVINH